MPIELCGARLETSSWWLSKLYQALHCSLSHSGFCVTLTCRDRLSREHATMMMHRTWTSHEGRFAPIDRTRITNTVREMNTQAPSSIGNLSLKQMLRCMHRLPKPHHILQREESKPRYEWLGECCWKRIPCNMWPKDFERSKEGIARQSKSNYSINLTHKHVTDGVTA